ncbi:MAG: TlpA family protein disulfide reductase [Nitriliruptoraceae bacterium]|nr:TlpA family protein disulfide reductase [Nitriliruptoraceae bacterium]
MVLRPARLAIAVVAATLALAACSSGDEVVDFGDGAPADDAPTLDADRGLSVFDAPAAQAVPPEDARLVTGGWPEAAAFIAREAEQDRPVLVNIFASWCGPCRAEMPMLLESAAEETEVTFLGIDHMDRLEDGEAFVEEFGIDFATLHDLDGDVAFAVGGRAMPTTVVFDRDGELAARVFGELTPTSLEQLLAEVR